MHTSSVSASISAYSNDYTQGGEGARNRENSKSLDFKLAYQLFSVKFTSADFFPNRYIFID